MFNKATVKNDTSALHCILNVLFSKTNTHKKFFDTLIQQNNILQIKERIFYPVGNIIFANVHHMKAF
ncbi:MULTISPECIES: OstA-like protein [unclassified Bartonella]|uniref:OstA-like protein n=1 Tax=unclassified Bartonella TaxID=2645622 RepID=UPI0035CE9583